MVSLQDVSLRRGTRLLLHGASVSIHAGQKVGLIGANGSGKSSLLALIRGELDPDAGELRLPRDWVIAHVAQETPAVDDPAIDYVMDGDTELRDLQRRLSEAEAFGDGHLQATLHARLDSIEAYGAQSRAAKLMAGLGFVQEQLPSPVGSFSGGWRMRLNLARALMRRSDLLLLDEPTNHLDLDAVLWLEEWLRGYPGALVLISHDRDFLDRVTHYILHIDAQSLTFYPGNYSDFEVQRAAALAERQAVHARQQREIEGIRRFVDRFRAKATKAKQAQSRLKALQRMELISQAHIDSPFNFEFYPLDNPPNPLLSLREVDAGYGEKTILNNVTFTILPQERIGLLGPNGAGKSTLVKLLARQMDPLKGQCTFAKGAAIGYFAQHQMEQLDSQSSALLHLQRLDARAAESELRSYLGSFGFHGDKALEAVASFSGGEKARLVLAIVVYQKPNVLLLDEPTNHLDLEMRHALTMALQGFEGAVIVVSHDRHLLRTVCDRFFLVYGGRVNTFDGDLGDYQLWLKEQAKADASASKPATEIDSMSRKQARQVNAEKRRQLQPLRNLVKKLELKIAELEQQKNNIDTQLAQPDIYNADQKSQLTELLKQQARVQQDLVNAEEQWMAAMEEMEQAEE